MLRTRVLVGRGVVAFCVAAVVFVGGAFAVVVAPAVWAEQTGSTRMQTLAVDGAQRSYRVYRSSGLGPRPGLVVDLHASGVSGFWEEAVSGMHPQADWHGWVVVYPDAGPRGWAAYGCCPDDDGGRDVAFLAALIDRAIAAEGVDPRRVYVMGLSRGGMMAYRAACELSARVAAVAVVAGNMADEHGDVAGTGCRPAQPVAVLAIHGTADTQVPFTGGGRFAPFADVVEYWRRLDECQPDGSCAAGVSVRSIAVPGGRHSFPGAPLQSAPWSPAGTLDASAVIADFFTGQSRALG